MLISGLEIRRGLFLPQFIKGREMRCLGGRKKTLKPTVFFMCYLENYINTDTQEILSIDRGKKQRKIL